MEAIHSLLPCCFGRHRNKGKTARFIRKLVENNLHFSDITDLAEQVLQFALSHRER
jgi:hypothetical protein